MTYNQVVQYAALFTGYSNARDLVHNLYIHLNRKGIDLFGVSKRMVYVSMYNLHRNLSYRSIDARNGYQYFDVNDYHLSKGANPEQVMIGKQLEATFSPLLRLKLEGYTQTEIGEIVGLSRRSVNKNTNKEIRWLSTR